MIAVVVMPSDPRNLSHGQPLPIQDFSERIRQLGDLPGWPVSRQLELLQAIASSDFGAFLMLHGGLNAYWTDHVINHPVGDPNVDPIEQLLLERMPAAVATRQRFQIFRQILQAVLAPNMVLASLPCGHLTDLLSLNYSAAPGARLVGIDLDTEALATARARAKRRGVPAELLEADAWEGSFNGLQADVLVSHGLSIYADKQQTAALYRRCHEALKPGGLLVTSFMTPPPALDPDSPWRLNMLNADDLALQKLIFTRILQPRWQARTSHDDMRALLQQAGFGEIVFYDDPACLFPTVTARAQQAPSWQD